jgi:hypothetical protein
MQHLVRLAVFAWAAPLALACGAQTLKPGLWEISNKMQSSSGQMEQAMAQAQQHMASMPPEQRKKMEDMLAKQGVAMGSAPGMSSVKICMSREMVERNEMPAQQPGDCKTTVLPRSGNTVKMSYTCSNPPSSGEGEYTLVSPEAYTSRMVSTTTVQGKPEKLTMQATGKWLSGDCGALKPPSAPAARK